MKSAPAGELSGSGSRSRFRSNVKPFSERLNVCDPGQKLQNLRAENIAPRLKSLKV